jgi:anaerobic selenocysteine-containing dehydrogenase
MGERKIVYTTCKSCHGGCGVKVTLEDGVIVHIEGNPDSLTKGTMCSKGLSSIQHVDNPYRLKYPLKRAGEKGEGKWKRISWMNPGYHRHENEKGIAEYGPLCPFPRVQEGYNARLTVCPIYRYGISLPAMSAIVRACTV